MLGNFLTLIIINLVLEKSFGLKLIAANNDASDHFKSLGKWSSESKIQCAGFLDTQIKESNGNSKAVAIRYENGFCELGELGLMPGDFKSETKSTSDSDKKIYILSKAPKTKNVGQHLHFFLSYLSDNKETYGIVKKDNEFKRIVPYEIDGPWEETWEDDVKYILDRIPFKTNGIDPIFIIHPYALIKHLAFQVDPISIKSFSIFGWSIIQYSHQGNDGILSFGSTDEKFDQEAYYVHGLPKQSARPCFAIKGYDKCSSVGYTDMYQWMYDGVVFDSDEGSVTFYLNGSEMEKIQNSELVGKEWTNIQYFLIGASPQGTGGFLQAPRGSVELHLKPMNAEEAENQYRNAMTYFEE